jgi:hypothetical protein
MAPGVRAVGAPDVWSEFGIDGSGTIVGILDTGVDATHPALADRWRGNFAPAAECWFDAAGAGDPSFPVDHGTGGHGTHVMGTLTGLAPGDTIGVAPGAHWIAANPILTSIPQLDSAVLASLEFMTDPDGDPSTTDDVPDVVQNSWGINEGFHGFFDCDSRWWDAIDNCEAAGVVLTWSAGNEGPYAQSIRSPADRTTNPLNCFAVGATKAVPPFLISDFSSRGPSGCGGAEAIKPEIVAPGEDIYSAEPGGGYQLLSGTSMAGPHVAGVVALMRQANPDLDVVSIKEILLATAVDMGEPGQDNTYGHGFIDARAAVAAALTESGTLSGTITDQATGLPVPGATVANVGGFNSVLTDANGDYRLTMLAGPVDFRVSRYGYFDEDFSVTIPAGAQITQDATLAPMPVATISGHVYGPDDQVVAGATVRPLGIPVEAAVADATGLYQLTLPLGGDLIYELYAAAAGLGAQQQAVPLPEDQILDFHLPALVVEDFESGDFSTFPWRDGGNGAWFIDPDSPFEGVFSARSADVINGQESVLALDFFVSADSYLQFWSKVSAEPIYDGLQFWLDGVLMAFMTGEQDWTQVRLLVPRGHHEFRWVYHKDEVYSEGADAAWLDFVEFPAAGPETAPEISLETVSVVATVAAGDATSVPYTIGNTGGWLLDFDLDVGEPLKRDGPADPWVTVNPAHGQIAPGFSQTVSLEFDATGLAPGVNVSVMTVRSTDPVTPEIPVPLILTVTSSPAAADLAGAVVFQGAVPNPFNPTTVFHFSLPATATVALELFDLSGRRVRSLVDGELPAGPHAIAWDGRDASRRQVASGTYLARLTVAGAATVKSVTLVR